MLPHYCPHIAHQSLQLCFFLTHQDAEKAALKIQAVHRGRSARKQIAEMKAAKTGEEESCKTSTPVIETSAAEAENSADKLDAERKHPDEPVGDKAPENDAPANAELAAEAVVDDEDDEA